MTVPSPVTLAIADACKRAEMVVSIGVNERDGGTLCNARLLFDADGTLLQRRRKISPTYHELLSLLIDRTPRAHVHERGAHRISATLEEQRFAYDTNGSPKRCAIQAPMTTRA